MEEKYKKFLEFNWRDCVDWHSYFSNIYPTPPGSKVDFYKRKYYQQKIDPEFDRNYVQPEPSTTQSNTNTTYGANANRSQYNPSAYSPSGLNSPVIAMVEAVLWIGFLLSI